MTSLHPMLAEKRPLIFTRPMERLADHFKLALEQGSSGMHTHGDGRIGKTKAAMLLARREDWRPWPMAFYLMNYSNPTNASEGYFFNSILNATNQKTLSRAFGTDVLARARNHLMRQCHLEQANIIVLVINETNRFGESEFSHLVSLENDIDLAGKRLFVLFMSQNDADPGGPQSIFRRMPIQISGRFLNTKHHYTGLLWDKPQDELENGLEDDVFLGLQQYDIGVLHGEEGIPCSRWFAPRACAAGWSLCSQYQLIRQVATELRAEYDLPELEPWAMQTFDATVYYLIVRVAGENPAFVEFTAKDIRKAFQFSGYIELELNRHPDKRK